MRCRHFRRGEQRGGTAEFNPAFARRGGGRRPITRSVTSARPLIRRVMMLTQPSESIGRCFDEHGAAVYAYVRGMVGPIRAEAITRDVFVELLCGDTPAANGHSVRTALLALSDRFVTTALHGRQDDPSTSSDGLDSAFASLTQDDRRAVLFVAHGDSHSETSAEALQLSVQVMATRVRSGLRHLGLAAQCTRLNRSLCACAAERPGEASSVPSRFWVHGWSAARLLAPNIHRFMTPSVGWQRSGQTRGV